MQLKILTVYFLCIFIFKYMVWVFQNKEVLKHNYKFAFMLFGYEIKVPYFIKSLFGYTGNDKGGKNLEQVGEETPIPSYEIMIQELNTELQKSNSTIQILLESNAKKDALLDKFVEVAVSDIRRDTISFYDRPVYLLHEEFLSSNTLPKTCYNNSGQFSTAFQSLIKNENHYVKPIIKKVELLEEVGFLLSSNEDDEFDKEVIYDYNTFINDLLGLF